MLNGAHQQLPGGKIVLVWDNLTIHHSAAMRAFVDAHADWLTVFYLLTYAPELNPAESVWSLLKRSMANFLAADPDELASPPSPVISRPCSRAWATSRPTSS